MAYVRTCSRLQFFLFMGRLGYPEVEGGSLVPPTTLSVVLLVLHHRNVSWNNYGLHWPKLNVPKPSHAHNVDTRFVKMFTFPGHPLPCFLDCTLDL